MSSFDPVWATSTPFSVTTLDTKEFPTKRDDSVVFPRNYTVGARGYWQAKVLIGLTTAVFSLERLGLC